MRVVASVRHTRFDATMDPDGLNVGKDGNAVKHGPLGADFELVVEGISHLLKCITGHVRHYLELERADVVSVLVG